MNPPPAFIAVTGDMAQALPNTDAKYVDDEHYTGDLPAFRPAQTTDFQDSLRQCNQNVPILIGAGMEDCKTTFRIC